MNKAGYLKMFRVLQHFTKEDRVQCITRLHRLNRNLRELVDGAPQTAVVEANKFPKFNVAGHYQRVRKHAIMLYDSLKEKLQKSHCLCKVCTIHLFYRLKT